MFMLRATCNHPYKAELFESQTPIKDRYVTPRVSSTAKKSFKGEVAARNENKVICRLVKKLIRAFQLLLVKPKTSLNEILSTAGMQCFA